jgi:transcriptional regulator with XRE-family HTH domain
LLEVVQVRIGRAALGWSGRDLAKASRVSLVTIARLETGANTTVLTLTKLQKALEKGGVIFIPRDAGGGPGVRLKR